MTAPVSPPPPPPKAGPPSRPKPPARAEVTFSSALTRPSAEREAFLAEACGDDAALQGEVRALIAAHEAAGDFQKTEAASSPEVEAELARLKPEESGEMIGPYKLREQLGEGGFGIVWVAEQEHPVRRRVALKIVKLGMDTREVIARFEQERQAVALMDHPNIAKVFDAGATQFGRPFFVMEVVKGVPITQFCDEAQLGTRERLALFGDVCSAINHAHQKGVIHRDIKPSNVMITLHADEPVVKVIDFGIAKATQGKLTDKTLFTRYEQFVGTPAYMSPEQATHSGLDVDTRSDIYALGILLYELLTGKPPFDADTLACAGYEEMRRIIRDVEPPKPSSRLSTVVGEERTLIAKARHIEPDKIKHLIEPDLDWIVMKAIEKDRSRRYETANGLAADIRRFLADEPVSARPPSARYQFQKFARRNKVALRVASGIAAVLLAATAVSSWLAVRETRAENRATAEAERATTAEKQAKGDAARATAAEARALVAQKDAEDISQFLGDVFLSPDPTRDGREIKVVELLDKAAEKLNTDLGDQPAQRTKLQAALARTYHALGLYQEAIELREKVRDYYVTTSGPDHPATLSVMGDLARSYLAADRWNEAIKLGEETLALSRKVLGLEHPKTLSAMNELTLSYTTAKRRDEAIKLGEEALALCRKILGAEHPETLSAMSELTLSYASAKRGDEAIKLGEEALALCRKNLGADHSITLKTMGHLAVSYSAAGRQDEALKMCDEVLALSRKAFSPGHPETLAAINSLAVSYSAVGRKDEAIKIKEEVLALCHKVLGPRDPKTAEAAGALGYLYDSVGQPDKAIKAWSESVQINPKQADVQYYLSRILCFGGHYADALEPLRAACALYPDGERGREMRTRLATALSNLGRAAEAVTLLTEVAIRNPDNTPAAVGVAAMQAWFGKDADHAATCQRMIQWARDATKPDDLDRVAKLVSLRPVADASLRDAALALARRSVELGQGHAWLPYFHLSLGMAEYRSGHYTEAEHELREAAQTAPSLGVNPSAQVQGIAGCYRAMSLAQRGRPDEARVLLAATEEKIKPLPSDDQNPLADNADHDDLVLWLALKEVRALLAEPAPPAK